MNEAGEQPPDSGPTITTAEALARDRKTGRFVAGDGCGRSPAERAVIAARRAQVAKLYPDLTPTVIATKLGWKKPTINKDVAWLVEHGLVDQQRPGPRRKHPDAKERHCKGCGVLFTPPNWAPDQSFHDEPCARAHQTTELVRERARALKTAMRRRADKEIARLNEVGYLTSRQFAAERKVTESAVSRYIAEGLLKAERRTIEGEPHQLIRREEINRFNAKEWPRILERMGPGLPANFGGRARQRWGGRTAATKPPAPGSRPRGGQRVELTPDQESLIRRRRAMKPKRGSRAIAEEIGVGRQVVRTYVAENGI